MDIIQIKTESNTTSVTEYTFVVSNENTITKTTTIQETPLGLSKGLEAPITTTIKQSENFAIRLGG